MEYFEQFSWESFVQEDCWFNVEGYCFINIEIIGQGDDCSYWGIYIESFLWDIFIKVISWGDFVKVKCSMVVVGFLFSNV